MALDKMLSDPALCRLLERIWLESGFRPTEKDARQAGWHGSKATFYSVRERWMGDRKIPKRVAYQCEEHYKPIDIAVESEAAKRRGPKLAPEVERRNGRPINDPAAQLTASERAIKEYNGIAKRLQLGAGQIRRERAT